MWGSTSGGTRHVNTLYADSMLGQDYVEEGKATRGISLLEKTLNDMRAVAAAENTSRALENQKLNLSQSTRSHPQTALQEYDFRYYFVEHFVPGSIVECNAAGRSGDRF